MRENESSRFSFVGFAVALVTVGVGAAVGLRFVPVVGTYVGMLAGGFVAGLAIEHRPTVESGVAAVLASLGILVAGALPGSGVVAALGVLGAVNPVTLLLSAALAFAVGAFGGHFGDDLRDGLTEPLPESTSGRSAGTAASATERNETVDVDGERAGAEGTEAPVAGTADADATDERSTDPEVTERDREDDLEYELEDDY